MADSAAYLSMAEQGVWAGGASPHRYRILVPLLARLMPFELETNFLLLSAFAVGCSSVLLFIYLRRLGCSKIAAAVGVLFFLQLRSVVACFTHPIETDSWGWLATIAALVLLQRGKVFSFIWTVTVGVLARESVLFVLGVFCLQEWRNPVRCLAVTVLPLVVFLGIRAVIPGPEFWQYYLAEIPRLWQRRVSPEWWHVMPFNIYNAFGPLWILACMRLRAQREFLKKHSLFIALVMAQLVVASDEMRLLTLLFPVVLPLCVMAIDEARGLTNTAKQPLFFAEKKP